MPKKNSIYIGEIYLSPDGIVIENDNESKTFSMDDIKGFTAHLAKVALDPPTRNDSFNWNWSTSSQDHVHHINRSEKNAYINIDKLTHQKFHEYFINNVYKEKT
jgi:hypothetical protein